MACGCGGRTSASNPDTVGYYVVLPDGSTMPQVNVEDPDAGEAPFFSVNEARTQVTLNGGGTIRRLRRVDKPASVSA
jgi:hypothetical protein